MMYDEFASLYDKLMYDFDYENWFKYIEKIFTRYNSRPNTILEMACGTGNLSYFFGEKGYKLTCFDLSSEMLSIAHQKLNHFKNVKILNQDMIDFELNEQFDAVVAACDSINYIIDEEDLLSVFNNVYKHLKSNGIFIFDINSFYKLKNTIGDNTFAEDLGDIFYTWQNSYNNKTDICNFYLTFFHSNDGVNYRRADEFHKQGAYKKENIQKILEQAGFRQIEYYDCFTFDEPKKDAERINFVALK